VQLRASFSAVLVSFSIIASPLPFSLEPSLLIRASSTE
jgi:hypothetical protein